MRTSSGTDPDFRQRRRDAARERWKGRIARWSWYAVLAETFLLALYPAGAIAALLAAVLLLLVRLRLDPSFCLRHLPFDVPAGLFILISGVSVLASPDRGFSFYNWYNLVGVYALTYLVVGQQIRTSAQLREWLTALGMAAVLVVLYGFYQYVFGIDISAMKWVDGDAFPELRKRVFSTWENPNILAGYLDIMICMAFGLFIKADSKGKRCVLGVAMLLLAACLAMTYARGACLVIAILFAIYGVLKERRVLLTCLVVGGGLLLLDPVLYERLASVFTKVDTSSEMRLAFWESTVAMIQDHPFLGIGWGAYWMVYPEYDFYLQGADIRIVHAHNLYLNYAAEIGLPGAAAFLWFFFGTMITALRQTFRVNGSSKAQEAEVSKKNEEGKKTEEEQQVDECAVSSFAPLFLPFWQEFLQWPASRLLEGASLGMGLAVLSIALNGLTDDLLFNIPSSMLFWMLAAAASAVSLQHEEIIAS